jgi:hypothetical protein
MDRSALARGPRTRSHAAIGGATGRWREPELDVLYAVRIFHRHHRWEGQSRQGAPFAEKAADPRSLPVMASP